MNIYPLFAENKIEKFDQYQIIYNALKQKHIDN